MKNLNVKRISLLVLGIASVIGSIVFFRTSIANLFDSFAKAQWEFMQNSSDEIGIVCFVFFFPQAVQGKQ